MSPIIAKESVEIPVGRYTGEIVKVDVSTNENKKGESVQYVNFHVQTTRKDVKGWNGQFRLSCPFYLTKQSALGRLLTRLNIEFEADEEFDEQSLKGMAVSFDTVREGYFTNPVMDSVAPVESDN